MVTKAELYKRRLQEVPITKVAEVKEAEVIEPEVPAEVQEYEQAKSEVKSHISSLESNLKAAQERRQEAREAMIIATTSEEKQQYRDELQRAAENMDRLGALIGEWRNSLSELEQKAERALVEWRTGGMAKEAKRKAGEFIKKEYPKVELLGKTTVPEEEEIKEIIYYTPKVYRGRKRTDEEIAQINKIIESRIKKGYLTEEELLHLGVEEKTPEEITKMGYVYDERLGGWISPYSPQRLKQERQNNLIAGIKANKTVGQLRSEGYSLYEIGLTAKKLEQEQKKEIKEIKVKKPEEKKPLPKIPEWYAKYLIATKQIGEVASLGLMSRLEMPAPFTKEEMARLQEIAKKPETIFGYPKKMYEYVKLTEELKSKVDESSKFTEKVKPIIEENYKNLEKENKEYLDAISNYNKFIENKGIKKDGTYELNEKDYETALLYSNALNDLKTKFDEQAAKTKNEFDKAGIKYQDTAQGIEITDERIKRMGKYQTLSQVYLQEKEKEGYKELLKGQIILGTVWGLETAGWTVALSTVIPVVTGLPVIKQVLGLGKYIATPIKVTTGLALAAGFTGVSAYKGYKELEPIRMGKAGAIMGATSFVGGVAVAGTLMKLGDATLKMIENPEFAKNVKSNIMQLLEDESGELFPAKRKAKARQKLIQIEKEVTEKIEYTKEQSDFEFKQANYERQKEIVKNIIRKINLLPTKEEKLQGALNLKEMLIRNLGKEKAVELIKEIFGIKPIVVISYGVSKPAEIKPISRIIYTPPKTTQIYQPPRAGIIFKPLTISQQMERYRLETGLGLRQGQLKKFKQEQKSMQKSVQALSQKYNQQVRQAQELALKQEQKLQQQYKLSQKTMQAQSLKQKSQQVQEQRQIYRQQQKIAQQQKVRQEQILRQAQRLIPTLRVKPTSLIKPREKIKVPPIFKLEEDRSAKRRKELEEQSEQAYQALIKRRGEFKPIGKPMLKAKAIRLGEKVTKATLAAQFKVVPTRLRIRAAPMPVLKPGPKFRAYRLVKGKRIPLKDQFIEKRRYRLETPTERAEIQAARRKASLKEKKSNLKIRSFVKLR